MWDESYSAEEYAYGTKPNKFLEENFNCIPKGHVLRLEIGAVSRLLTFQED